MPTRDDGGRAEIRTKLRIDDDDLDRCLVEQPDYFFKAAEKYAEFNAQRDLLKLELKELTAQLDQDIRTKALREEVKITENAIANQITTLPKIKDLQRKLLEAQRAVEDWSSLKEGFVQRSYALKDLTAIQLARFNNLGVELGSVGARRDVGDRNRQRAEEMRREQRQQGSTQPRFRSRSSQSEE
jgi:hypothetical protein